MLPTPQTSVVRQRARVAAVRRCHGPAAAHRRPRLPPSSPAACWRAAAAARRGHGLAGAAQVQAPEASDAPQPQPSRSSEQGSFDWRRQWYPAAIVSQLDPARPTARTVLGVPLVIWRDGSGTWRAFEDRCPHRLAPLSEGRLDAAAGTLMCSYHGWQFEGASGACTSIPQIADPAAHAAACSARRTCATAFPTQVSQGLLWVLPDAALSPEAAAAVPLAAVEQYGAVGWTLLGGEWFERELAYGFDTLMENLFDPSHIPFAHHKIMGSATRDKAQPLAIRTTRDVSPLGGFELARDSAPFRTAAPTDTVNTWAPPCLNVSAQTNTAKGTTLVLAFYGVPVAPGKSRVITAFFTNAKLPGFVQALARLPLGEAVFHMGQNQVLDSDAMLLHVQERLLQHGPEPGWRSAFYMPAGADTGIRKFREWLDAVPAIPWPGAAASQGLGPVQPKQVVMDRLSQHTLSCKACSGTLRALQRLQAATLGLAALAAAGALAAAAAAWAASAAAAAAPPAAAAGLAATLAAVPAWQAGAAGLLALALLAAHAGLGRLKQRLLYVGYDHAAIA